MTWTKMTTVTATAVVLAATAAAGTGRTAGAEKGFDYAGVLARSCESCHYRGRICARIGRTGERKWRAIIARMMRHGARIDEREARLLARSLAALGQKNDVCR